MTVYEFEKIKRYYYIYYNIYNNNSNLTSIFKNCHLSSVIDESIKLPNQTHKAGYDSYFVRTPDKVRRNARRGSLECLARFVGMSGTIEWKASL